MAALHQLHDRSKRKAHPHTCWADSNTTGPRRNIPDRRAGNVCIGWSCRDDEIVTTKLLWLTLINEVPSLWIQLDGAGRCSWRMRGSKPLHRALKLLTGVPAMVSSTNYSQRFMPSTPLLPPSWAEPMFGVAFAWCCFSSADLERQFQK